jgi:hypothetical protein
MHHSAQIMALKTLKDHAFWRVVASDHAAAGFWCIVTFLNCMVIADAQRATAIEKLTFCCTQTPSLKKPQVWTGLRSCGV